jgi:hypothetical protein
MHIPVIDWAVVFGILTLAGGFIIRVVIPGWIHVKGLLGGESGTTVKVQSGGGNGNGAVHVAEAEWRGKLGEQLNQQDKRLDALLVATAAVERVVVEIERRSQGQEGAIRTVTEMARKVDTILGITRRRSTRGKS